MTTTTTDQRTARARLEPPGTGLTQGRVVAAEAIKLRGTRSAVWLLALTALSLLVVGVFPAAGVVFAGLPAGEGTDASGGALTGVSLAQLLAAGLGALVVTSEYGSGLIRATLTAVPRRLPVLVGKVVVVATATLGAAVIAVFAAFFAAQALLSTADVSLRVTAPGVLRALVGSAVYLALSAVLGVACGWLLRSTAGALAGLFGVLFLLPVVGLLVPQVDPYLPSNAGAAILQTAPAGGALPPWLGLGVFALYVAAALAAAAVVLSRRDA